MPIGFSQHKTYQAGDAVFVNAHGINDLASVSILPMDNAGRVVKTIQAGQILVHIASEGGYLPSQVAYVKTAVNSKNDIEITDDSVFSVGTIIRIGDDYRVVTKKTGAVITVNGAALTLAVGDLLIVTDSYNGRLATKQVTGSSGSTTINFSDVRPFITGQNVWINKKSYPVNSIDQTQNTITVKGDVTLQAGDPVIGPAPSRYKISTQTVKVNGENGVLVSTRDYGRVRVSSLVGFDRSLAGFFKNIEFDQLV